MVPERGKGRTCSPAPTQVLVWGPLPCQGLLQRLAFEPWHVFLLVAAWPGLGPKSCVPMYGTRAAALRVWRTPAPWLEARGTTRHACRPGMRACHSNASAAVTSCPSPHSECVRHHTMRPRCGSSSTATDAMRLPSLPVTTVQATCRRGSGTRSSRRASGASAGSATSGWPASPLASVGAPDVPRPRDPASPRQSPPPRCVATTPTSTSTNNKTHRPAPAGRHSPRPQLQPIPGLRPMLPAFLAGPPRLRLLLHRTASSSRPCPAPPAFPAAPPATLKRNPWPDHVAP